MNTYRPHEFAKLIKRSVQTLQRWDREGILKACRTPTNRRYYTHGQYLEYIGQKASPDKKVVVYCRVSSASQKNDLQNQINAAEKFCLNAGLPIGELMTDIGSGLNYSRKNFVKLLQMVESGSVGKIVVAHKDRLVRFGFEWFEQFCKNHGAEIVVMNQQSLSPEQEMVQDMLTIIHCFSSRLYGLRKYKKKIKEYLLEKDGEELLSQCDEEEDGGDQGAGPQTRQG